MITLTGQSVCGGISFGRIYTFSREESQIKRHHIENSDDEIKRFEKAVKQAHNELDALYKKALSDVGKSNAMIFQIHQLMLVDPDYTEAIKNIIANEALNAETAVAQTCDSFVGMFGSMEDGYMRERSADVRDVSERLIRILEGRPGNGVNSEEPVIIISDDLVPSELVQFDKNSILAFATEKGSVTSHTSILARMMNIPAVIGVNDLFLKNYNGKCAVVDGFEGKIYIDPDESTVLEMTRRQKQSDNEAKQLETLKGLDNITKDGQKIRLCANIGGVLDVSSAFANDADGIGLFRSEYLYLDGKTYPSEEAQFEAYKSVLQKTDKKQVVIRTLDIGADKKIKYFNMPHEENPALGIRAIRICLRRPEIFKEQLRALYRASVYGNLAIMFPMVSSEWEILKTFEIIGEVKKELDSENIPYSDNIQLGCMIETPAAAVISDVLTNHLDFVSIGTNDLVQYTLAADRQNPYMGEFCNSRHKAVMRLIKLTADNAHKNGAWVGICGDLAADTNLTETFLAMGIDELSVVPNAILPLRKKIINTDVSKIKDEILFDINN